MNTEDKIKQVKEDERPTEIDDVAKLGIIWKIALVGIGIWFVEPLLASFIFSGAPVLLCFYLIKDAKAQYRKNKGVVVTGSFAGYLILSLILVSINPKKIKTEFIDQKDKETFPTANLMITSLKAEEKRKLAAENKIFLKTSRTDGFCNLDFFKFLCKIPTYEDNKSLLEIKTLTNDSHKERDLTIRTLDKSKISVIEEDKDAETSSSNTTDKKNIIKVGVLKNDDMSSNGFLNVNSDDSENIIETLNKQLDLKSTTLTTIRNTCFPRPEDFCRFPIHEVLVQKTSEHQEGEAFFCNANQHFREYEESLIKLSLLKDKPKDQLQGFVELKLNPMFGHVNSDDYREACRGRHKNQLIRVNPKDFNRLISGIPEDRCDEIEYIRVDDTKRYLAFARIDSLNLPVDDIEDSSKENNRKISQQRCVLK